MNFGVPQQEPARCASAATVRITARRPGSVALDGRITASTPSSTQPRATSRCRPRFANPGGKLRPGMFVQTQVAARRQPVGHRASRLRDQLRAVRRLGLRRRRPEGPDGKTYRGVRQQFVKLGGSRGDQVAVLSGVKPGEEVVTSGVFKLRNGAAVQVNNEVQPANNAAARSRRTAR